MIKWPINVYNFEIINRLENWMIKFKTKQLPNVQLQIYVTSKQRVAYLKFAILYNATCTWSRDPSVWNFTKTIFVLGKCGGDQWHWMEDKETLMGMARQDGGRCSVAVRAPVRNMKSKHLHLLATWRHTPEVNLRFHCSFFLVSSIDDSFHSRSWFDAIRFVIAYTVDLRSTIWANIYYTFQVFIEP